MSLLIDKFKYDPLERVDLPDGRFYAVDGCPVHSVTTILSATKDMSTIDAWRNRIGTKNADLIVKESAFIGTHMHNMLEAYIKGEEYKTGTNPFRKQARQLADIVIDDGLSHLTEAWGTEVNLHYETLYAGTTDLVGIYDGEEAIVDYKNSRRPKPPEYIHEYKQQLVAYGTAHNNMFGTSISKGVLLIMSREGEYFGHFQKVVLEGDEWKKYETEWHNSLEKFYELVKE